MAPEEGQFITKYHKAVTLAVKDQLDSIKPRIASDWINDWKAQLGGRVSDEEEFREKFEDFLANELGFASETTVTINDGVLTIDVGGCQLCPANEILRDMGEQTNCPILPTGLIAISRVLGKNATLLEVDKPGTVGLCKIRYRLADKR